jgi:hypothetical protein
LRSLLLGSAALGLFLALQWLRSNNPLYAAIVINEEEMASWSFENDSEVPVLAYQRMVREEETAEELIRAAQIALPTDRGQEPLCQQSTVEDIVAQLAEKSNGGSGQSEPTGSVQYPSLEEAAAAETAERVFELRSSAIFQSTTKLPLLSRTSWSLSVWPCGQSISLMTATKVVHARWLPCRLCRFMAHLSSRSSGYRAVESVQMPSHQTISRASRNIIILLPASPSTLS